MGVLASAQMPLLIDIVNRGHPTDLKSLGKEAGWRPAGSTDVSLPAAGHHHAPEDEGCAFSSPAGTGEERVPAKEMRVFESAGAQKHHRLCHVFQTGRIALRVAT
jgi:hypothetical protein